MKKLIILVLLLSVAITTLNAQTLTTEIRIETKTIGQLQAEQDLRDTLHDWYKRNPAWVAVDKNIRTIETTITENDLYIAQLTQANPVNTNQIAAVKELIKRAKVTLKLNRERKTNIETNLTKTWRIYADSIINN